MSTLSPRSFLPIAATFAIAFSTALVAQVPFGTGNLVVVRTGDGTAPLNSAATAVALDEYTTAGAALQSVPLPTTVNGANLRLVHSGSATSEGLINLSEDGRYLVMVGYDAAPGTAAVVSTSTGGATPVLRVVARIDRNAVIDTSTGLTAYSGNNIRTGTTRTGSDFWVGGPGNGVSYVPTIGSGTSIQLANTPNNVRVVRVESGQLYASSATGAFQGVSAVGAGLPTTVGQTIALLGGFPTTSGPSSYDYAFVGAGTLYVADDRTSVSGGIQKWSFNGTAWVLQYTINLGTSNGARGLTATLDATGQTVLYATTVDSNANRIVTVTDTGAGSTFTTLATAAANTVFRGIRFLKPLAAVTVVGTGCPGTGGLVPALSATELPYIGNVAFATRLTQAPAGAAAFLFLALGTDPVGIPLGGGCTIHLDYPTLLAFLNTGFTPSGPFFTDPAGEALLAFPIPFIPQLAGIHAGFQAAVADAGAPLGVTVTNALDLLLY